LLLALFAVFGAARASTNTVSSASGLPPLDPAIVALVETNRAAIVEHRIFYVTNAEITPVQKAQALFLIFKDVPAEQQRKVAHAAVRQVDDSLYFLVREPLFDATLPPPVLSVFMTDTLKRANRVKGPVLLGLAQREEHPLRDESRQMLRAYLGRDYGTNWAALEKAVAAWLEKNPN
jgi:hypothetical protein